MVNVLTVQVLDDLVDGNKVSQDDADKAKRQYEELHAAVLKAMAAEKQHLDEAKVLKTRLQEASASKDAGPGDDDLQTALQVGILHNAYPSQESVWRQSFSYGFLNIS